MDYYVSEVFPSSAINDAVLIPLFYEEHDALALAKGNHLIIYMIEDEYVTEPKSFEIYGVIERLIPVCYSHAQKSNLLVILTDLRTCILRADDGDPNHLITEKVGTFQNAWESARVPIKYAIHPTCLIIQLENDQLDLFPITSNCTLDYSFKIKVGRKSIISFQFIGPTSKVTRLAVLTEEYNKPPMIHLFEIDLMNRSYSEDPSFDVVLEDAYFMIPYDLDAHSIAIVFSTQQATRVMYNELKPKKKTATIFTQDRLIKMAALTTEFHIAIDQANKLQAVNIKEVGEVSFVIIGNVPQPSELIAINSNLAFVASNKDDSVFLAINQENSTFNVSVFDKIRSTGKIINFREFDDSIISFYERSVVESKLMCEYSSILQIEIPDFLHVFSFYFEGKNADCFVFSNELGTSIISETIDGEFIDLSDIFDTSTQTFEFYALKNDLFVQVTKQNIYLYQYIDNSLSTDKLDNICLELKMGNSTAILSSRYENTIAILTNENHIYFYDIINLKDQENENENENENDNNDDDTHETENITLSSFEIRQRSQVIFEKNQVSSISLSNDFLAVSCFNPYKVSIYYYRDGKFIFTRSVEIGPIVDIKFHNGTFYALSPTKKITLVQPNLSTLTVLDCPGQHSLICPINEKTMIICGPDPAIIIGHDKIYPLKVKSQIIDATISENRIALLTNDSLHLGSISQPFYINNSFSTKSKLLDIIRFDDLNIFVRYNMNNIVTFYSCFYNGDEERYGLENYFNESDKNIFGKLKKDENYVDYIKFNNFLIIGSNNRIIIYKREPEEDFVLFQSRRYSKQISKIGTFRDYFYIQFCEEIQFYYPSSFLAEVSDETHIIKPVFIIQNSARIMHSAFSNQLVAFVYSKKKIAIYSFDDYNERMIQYQQPFNSSETITSISIISETVIFGTNHGNIFSLDLIPDINSNSMVSKFDIDVKEGFNTGEMIVKMAPMKNNSFIMAAGVNGMSLKIEKFGKKHPKFYDFYRILSTKLTSVGLFRKEYQRCPKFGIYLKSIMQMCDKDLLSAFAALDANEKAAILEGSDISIELANEILQFEGI